MPRVKIIKQTAILYTTPTLMSIDNVKPKLHSRKHKNGNANDNKNKRSERDTSRCTRRRGATSRTTTT